MKFRYGRIDNEYIDGKLIAKPMPQEEHSTIQAELIIEPLPFLLIRLLLLSARHYT